MEGIQARYIFPFIIMCVFSPFSSLVHVKIQKHMTHSHKIQSMAEQPILIPSRMCVLTVVLKVVFEVVFEVGVRR